TRYPMRSCLVVTSEGDLSEHGQLQDALHLVGATHRRVEEFLQQGQTNTDHDTEDTRNGDVEHLAGPNGNLRHDAGIDDGDVGRLHRFRDTHFFIAVSQQKIYLLSHVPVAGEAREVELLSGQITKSALGLSHLLLERAEPGSVKDRFHFQLNHLTEKLLVNRIRGERLRGDDALDLTRQLVLQLADLGPNRGYLRMVVS